MHSCNRRTLVLVVTVAILLALQGLPLEGAPPQADWHLATPPDPDKPDFVLSPDAAVSVTYKDIASAGPLTHVYVGADSTAQVAHTLDGTSYEFYPPSIIPGDAGTFIVVDNVLYAPNFSQHGGTATSRLGAYTPLTQVSQTAVSGSGSAADPYRVVTVLDVGSTGLRIIQTDSYVVGAEIYRTDIQVSNSGAAAKSLILYRAADCYLGTSDYGYGLVDGVQRSVACTKNPNNEPAGRLLQFLPLTGGNRYYEARYSEIWEAIGSRQELPNTCRCAEYIDNGIALDWSASVPAGGQVAFAHLTAFSPQGALPLTLHKTADSPTSAPRGSNGYTIMVENPNATAVTLTSVSDDLPAGFTYVSGSTSGFTTANPAVNGQTLTWSGSFVVSASSSRTLHFNVLVSDQPGHYTNDARATAAGYSVSAALNAAPITVEVSIAPVDAGFRPNPDGFKFANWGGNYPLPPSLGDYTNSDTVAMFGEDDTCAAVIGPVCILNWGAAMWNEQVNFSMNGGHCDGMTDVALRFFKDVDQQSSYQAGASTTYALEQGNIRRHIAWNFVLQFTNPVQTRRNEGRQKTPNQVLQQIYLALTSGAPDPVNLAIFGSGGHSILPYAIEDAGSGKYRVKVYDNNHPNDANRSVEFDTQANTWRYDLGGSIGVWQGGAADHSIVAAPLSAFLQQPQCPWCTGAGWLAAGPSAGEAPVTQTWSQGDGHVLLTDNSGRRIGYVADQFVNEIPGAFPNTPITGLGVASEPVYNVPLSDNYLIQLTGASSGFGGALVHFGQGYTVAADQIVTAPGVTEQLDISGGGTQVVYTAGGQQALGLTLATDDTRHVQFKLTGVDVGDGDSVQVSRDTSASTLTVNHALAGSSIYTLEVGSIDSSGLSEFINEDIAINGGDTQLFDLAPWQSTDVITMCTDIGSNGTIDSCIDLQHEGSRVYLPLVTRNFNAIEPSELIVNGDFEQGAGVGWLEYSSQGWPLVLSASSLPLAPRGGSWAAWLGGDDSEISVLYQQVTVPPANSTLYFWYQAWSEDACGYDFGGVVVNGAVADTFDLCSTTSTWVQRSVNLASWAGQSVQLEIRAETDSSLVSSLFVDDVAFSGSAVALGTGETGQVAARKGDVLPAPSAPDGDAVMPRLLGR